MTDYTAFFLDNSGGVMQLECLEISHPSFSQIFRYVRNDQDGLIINGAMYKYQPMSIQRANVTNDLEQKLSVTIADIEDELMSVMRNIRSSAYPRVKPKAVLKIFRDDDLTAPMIEMQTLEIPAISKDGSGLMTFEAQAPELNSVKTGKLYTFEDYPLLKGI